MAGEQKLTYTVALVLQSISIGNVYGYSVMVATGLPSGTVYPALGRLERDDLILSRWEKQAIAEASQRPARKNYKITRAGIVALKLARERYSDLEKALPDVEMERV